MKMWLKIIKKLGDKLRLWLKNEKNTELQDQNIRSNPTVNIDVNIENNDGVPMQIVEGNLHDGQDGLDEVVRADEHDDQYGGVKSHIMD